MTRRNDSPLRQLTVRGFDAELSRAIRETARAEGISLNAAVVRLLRKGAGTAGEQPSRNVVGGALDHLAGTWSASEADEFERAVEPLEHIDEELWRTPPPPAPRAPRRRR